MSKTKTFREKDNERVHGKISYRKRLLEESEAQVSIGEFLGRERIIEEQEAESLIKEFEFQFRTRKCMNKECYCTGECKVDR